MQPNEGWTPRRLSELREKAGFSSQRQLSIKSGVDQQTISRIEAGGTLSLETSQKLAPFLHVEHPALFIGHNLAVTAGELVRGYLSLNQAKRDRNYIEHMLQQTKNLPNEQFAACQATLERLNAVVWDLQAVQHKYEPEWDAEREEVVDGIRSGMEQDVAPSITTTN